MIQNEADLILKDVEIDAKGQSIIGIKNHGNITIVDSVIIK